jgi:hypothetical protein
LAAWAQAAPITTATVSENVGTALPAAGVNAVWSYDDEDPALFDQDAAMRRCLANKGIAVWNLRDLAPLDPVSLRSRSRTRGSPIPEFAAFIVTSSSLFALSLRWSRRRKLCPLRDAPADLTTTPSQTVRAPARAA